MVEGSIRQPPPFDDNAVVGDRIGVAILLGVTVGVALAETGDVVEVSVGFGTVLLGLGIGVCVLVTVATTLAVLVGS